MHNIIKLRYITKKPAVYCCSLSSLQSEEYVKVPEYPPIQDLSREAKKRQKAQTWADTVRAVKTIEEKQIKLNISRFFGYRCAIFDDKKVPYNSLPIVQHWTRTHFIETSKLPSFYDKIIGNVDSIKSEIENAILFEHDVLKSHELYKENLDVATEENILSDRIINTINRIILNNLPTDHLRKTIVDYDPRHEAFWLVGGINPQENIIKTRKGRKYSAEWAYDPINHFAQYVGKPSLALRTELPLECIISLTDAENPDLDVPFCNYDPKNVGFLKEYRHGTNIPGFWPGDAYEFGLLSFQRRGHIHNRSPTFGEEDNQAALHSQAMMSSFAWLLAQASFQGFTTYNDLTYPLVTQTIVTNGQFWSFYVYQLNTILMHSHNINDNPRRNVCWGGRPEKLYESIENGKIIGFNDEVLAKLIKFYSNIPKERLGVNLKPYLDRQEQKIADIADDEKRDWLEKQYKHMMSNRPKHRLLYEIYHWEKIYKIDHKTRPMEKRLRPFELFQNPYKRRFDETFAGYIPKGLRPEGPKSKNKFRKSYWP